MKLQAIKLFCSPMLGNVNEGDIFICSDEQAKHYIQIGVAKIIEQPKKQPVKTVKKKAK